MKTIKQVAITPIYNEFNPIDSEMKDGECYISEKYHCAVHRCLCGCGEKTVLPLNYDGSTHGWDLIKESNGTVSFTPSIGNFQLPCKSHYIITKNIANFV